MSWISLLECVFWAVRGAVTGSLVYSSQAHSRRVEIGVRKMGFHMTSEVGLEWNFLICLERRVLHMF